MFLSFLVLVFLNTLLSIQILLIFYFRFSFNILIQVKLNENEKYRFGKVLQIFQLTFITWSSIECHTTACFSNKIIKILNNNNKTRK